MTIVIIIIYYFISLRRLSSLQHRIYNLLDHNKDSGNDVSVHQLTDLLVVYWQEEVSHTAGNQKENTDEHTQL